MPWTITSDVNRLEVSEMKMCTWACAHTLRDDVMNDNVQGETEGREHE